MNDSRGSHACFCGLRHDKWVATLHCEVGRARVWFVCGPFRMLQSGASSACRALSAAFRQGCACAMSFVRIMTKNTGQIDAAKWKITHCVGGNLNEL